MEFLFGLIVGVLGFILLGWLAERSERRQQAGKTAETPIETAAQEPQTESPGEGSPEAPKAQLYAAAERFMNAYQSAARPADLLDHEGFRQGVDLLAGEHFGADDLIAYAQGDNPVIACMSFQALIERGAAREHLPTLLDAVAGLYPWAADFALRALDAAAEPDEPVVAAVLTRLHPGWLEHPAFNFLADFVAARKEKGESPSFGEALSVVDPEQLETIQLLVSRLDDEMMHTLREELAAWSGSRVDRPFLDSVGSLWSGAADAEAPVLSHAALDRTVGELLARLRQDPPRSVVLVGEDGVGKSAAIRSAARTLQEEGWTIFEAGHTELLAGQVYLGQLEQRIRDLLARLGGRRRVLWYVPDLSPLAWTGKTNVSPVGVLDTILPQLAAHQITLVSEATPAGWEKLAQVYPRAAAVVDPMRVEPLDEQATLDLARAWSRSHAERLGVSAMKSEAVGEACLLARQFLTDRAAPGCVLDLLQRTHERLESAEEAVRSATADDVIETLSVMSGLPREILDERRELDLDSLRGLFARRVMGQVEAVDCLVERVAMLKAGLNDPGRPLGVFLFAGPTGTGKTEIAKTLAEFLFGSAERLLRIDMSELQTADSLDRILGGAASGADSLAQKIRKQPFSVVLLDEFEKAAPAVWDLFLQVFDDGRLTDKQGVTSDCRHCLFIMTSNLGAAIRTGQRLVFGDHGPKFSMDEVRKTLSEVFAPEFMNRLDRVVIFRPLARDTMRDILKKELDQIGQRRGLRTRDWAIVWDESAFDFLLEKGFTVDLGARPLKRAIERYLLTPLSLAIVDHKAPEGDQFMLVKGGTDTLDVEFIDPDAPEEESRPPFESNGTARLALETIALGAQGNEELHYLKEELDLIAGEIESEDWERRKNEALTRMNDDDFWDSSERFAILGDYEYRDRVGVALRTARSLAERLEGSAEGEPSRDLLTRLAEQLFLLREAHETLARSQPLDAFLLVEAVSTGPDSTGDGFAARLASMYRSWGLRRRMSLDSLEERPGTESRPYRFLASVSGFGAYRLLAPESGLHVFELPEDDKGGFRRVQARVLAVGQPDDLAAERRTEVLRAARRELAAVEPPSTIVRRYREEPSPLVRDSVRGYRTGHFDRVIGGDFDLFSG